MSGNRNENPGGKSVERREFLKRAAIGAGAVAVGLVAVGCGSSSSGTSPAPSQEGVAAGVPSASAWQFAVMADTQWLAPDDGLNPNTCAVGLISQLNKQFVAQKVKFVVQVGDLADQASGASTEAGYATTASLCEDTRALFAQSLYANGIGFFACRGNHDDGSAAEFINLFPQTQSGKMNATPSAVFGLSNPDTAGQPSPAQSGSPFSLGSNFATIGSPANLTGLSYGFDFNNARFILIDQFTPTTPVGPDGNAYALGTTASLQQPWITSALANRAAGSHAFVFSHKGLITQQHIDVLFGDCPAETSFAAGANAATGAAAKTYNVVTGAASAFIRSMAENNARLYFCGHDHNHSRSLVHTMDAGSAAQITHILCQSVSSKFYVPNEADPIGNSNVPALTSNDAYFCGGHRQTMLSQELYAVGYYLVTVDGANVTVDYYSAPSYPVSAGVQTENIITLTPTLNFTKRETFGYSLAGKAFGPVLSGGTFTGVQDQGPSGTVAKILSGTSGNPNVDRSGRAYASDVNTGWLAETSATASDIFLLWGMGYTLGSDLTDVYTLSLTYDSSKGSSFVLATPDGSGNWTDAVNENTGGTKTLVTGPWRAGYGLGTYGMDPATGTVWAVLDYNGSFAAILGD